MSDFSDFVVWAKDDAVSVTWGPTDDLVVFSELSPWEARRLAIDLLNAADSAALYDSDEVSRRLHQAVEQVKEGKVHPRPEEI